MAPATKMCIQGCATKADCPADTPECVKHAHLVPADASEDGDAPAPAPAPKKTGM